MKKSSSMVARDQYYLTLPMTKFVSFMGGVLQTAEIAKVEVFKSKTAKLGTQKDGCRVDDTMEVSTLTRFDHENCTSWRHRILVPIGKTVDKVNIHNNKVKRDHR